MKRAYRMPFGAEYRNGATAFRLWAPGAAQVELVLGVDDADGIAMTPRDDGWYEHVCDAAPGTRYGFRIDERIVVPDPASRSNPDGVHGRSEVVDAAAYEWRDGD